MKRRNYKLTKQSRKLYGRKLYRIQALVDMPQHGVKAGDLGGFVESYENLSGNAWVGDNAKVFDNAQIWGNAKVSGNAEISGMVKIFNYAQVYGNAQIWGSARIFQSASVFDDANVFGDVDVCGDARIYKKTTLCGQSTQINTGDITNSNQISTFRIGGFIGVTILPKCTIVGWKNLTHKEAVKLKKQELVKLGLPAKLHGVYRSTLKAIIKSVSC